VEQIQKAPVRYRRSRQQVQELLNLFAKSNVSVKDFFKKQTISAANFKKWSSRYKRNLVIKEKT
jgi:hypothetical protein